MLLLLLGVGVGWGEELPYLSVYKLHPSQGHWLSEVGQPIAPAGLRGSQIILLSPLRCFCLLTMGMEQTLLSKQEQGRGGDQR